MVDNEIKLSVIIPVYNVEKYVGKAIESVISQNMTGIEIVVVNDGSTDNSLAVINEYNNFANYKIITKNNAGLGAARNTGMRDARGEYILFLDSDDYLVDNSLKKMYEIAKEEDLDVLQCAYRHINEEGKPIGGENCIESTPVMSGDEWIRNGHISYGACFCLYKHAFVKENNLYFMEGILHEDMDYTLHATYLAKRIRSYNYIFYNYLIRPQSITTNKSIKRCTDYYRVAKNVEKWVKSDVDEITFLEFFRDYIDFLYSHVVNLAVLQDISIIDVLQDDNLKSDVLSHLKNSKNKKYKLEYYILRLKLYRLYKVMYKMLRKGK